MSKLSRLAAGFVAAPLLLAALLCAFAGPVAGASSGKMRERAQGALRSGDFESAEKIYREMVAKDGRDAEARLGLSHALLKQRKNQDAYDQAARVLAVDPLSARAHALLGAAMLNSGDFRLSVEEFRTALSFREDEVLALAGLAMVDFYENRGQQSLAGLRRAAFLDPNEPDHFYNLGQAAARYERYKEASHFLRNVGLRGYAILDKHILRCMAEAGVIETPRPPSTRSRYLATEERLRRFAADLGLDFDELDLVLWSLKTGEILK